MPYLFLKNFKHQHVMYELNFFKAVATEPPVDL